MGAPRGFSVMIPRHASSRAETVARRSPIGFSSPAYRQTLARSTPARSPCRLIRVSVYPPEESGKSRRARLETVRATIGTGLGRIAFPAGLGEAVGWGGDPAIGASGLRVPERSPVGHPSSRPDPGRSRTLLHRDACQPRRRGGQARARRPRRRDAQRRPLPRPARTTKITSTRATTARRASHSISRTRSSVRWDRALAARADAVVENYAPGTAARLGYGMGRPPAAQ